MATPSSVSNGTVIQAAETFALNEQSVIAATALLVYPYLISLGREIDYIWKEPRKPASWIYLFIRYPALLQQLVSVSLNSYTPDCNAFARLQNVTWAMASAFAYIFQILRTYAVCGRNRALTVLLTVLCLPSIGMNLISVILGTCEDNNSLTYILTGGPDCRFSNLLNAHLDFRRIIESNTQLATDLAFESVVFCATVWKTWWLYWGKKTSSLNDNTSLVGIILRNGLVYYGIFFSLQLTQIVCQNVVSIFAANVIQLVVSELSSPIRWVLLTQLILDLRERANGPPGGSGMATPNFSTSHGTLQFVEESIVADLGEPLYPDVPAACETGREIIELEEVPQATPNDDIEATAA